MLPQLREEHGQEQDATRSASRSAVSTNGSVALILMKMAEVEHANTPRKSRTGTSGTWAADAGGPSQERNRSLAAHRGPRCQRPGPR